MSAARRRYAWSIEPTTFALEFFDPDAPGVYAPSVHGWPYSLRQAQGRALNDLKLRRGAVNAAIRKLTRTIEEAEHGEG